MILDSVTSLFVKRDDDHDSLSIPFFVVDLQIYLNN